MGSAEKFSPIDAARQHLANNDSWAAFDALALWISPAAPFVEQQRAVRLFRKMDRSALGLREIKIAVLAASTIDHLLPIAEYWLARRGLDATFWLAPYDTAASQCFDTNSELYAAEPDVIWLFSTWRDIDIADMPGATPEAAEQRLNDALSHTAALRDAIRQNSQAHVIINNADIPDSNVFGHLEASVPWSRRTLLRRYNAMLGGYLDTSVSVFDVDHIASCFGKVRWTDARYWYHAKNAFSMDASGLIGDNFAAIIAAAKGLSKKCLVLDLDNTLWGGVIGDDGLDGIKLGNGVIGEAHADIQRYAKYLKERGVILAICSKNDIENAKLPFEHHPDMQLSLDDIAVFIANWEPKPDNIRAIASSLNIGLDALVFLDDNPYERQLVRESLPMVVVPEVSNDPADYVRTLECGRYFEAVIFSEEDTRRTAYYQANAARYKMQATSTDIGSYLKSLGMAGTVGQVDKFHLPRAAQLINKSNQFHLTGTRYSEETLQKMLSEDRYVVRYFKLEDKFGDNGLISVVILEVVGAMVHIDTWVMSCRVLGRQMEEFIAAEIQSLSEKVGAQTIRAEYLKSAKNGLVAGLYQKLGFQQISEDEDGSTWVLDLQDKLEWDTEIKRIEA